MPATEFSSGTSQLELSTSQIRTFCTVFELGSYSAAARRIGLSTSAVWEQVKEIERQYATRLFVRQGRQVVATSSGQRLDDLLRPLLAGLDSTRQIMHQQSESWTGRVTIATGVRMLIEEVGTALRAFQRRHPDVSVCIHQSDSRDAEPLVANGDVDMALTLEPGPGYAGKAVTLEPAYDIDYLLIAPPRHPLGQKRRVHPADLAKYPLVVPHQDTYSRHLVDQMLHQHGLTDSARIVVETANSAFTAACVRAGLGVGMIAGQANGPLCKGLVVHSLACWLGQARIVFVRRRGAHLSPILRQLSDTIRSVTTSSRDKSNR